MRNVFAFRDATAAAARGFKNSLLAPLKQRPRFDKAVLGFLECGKVGFDWLRRVSAKQSGDDSGEGGDWIIGG